MKLPYSTILTDMAGNDIQTAAATEAAPAKFLTFKDALITAFSVQHPEDERMTPADRYALGKLGFAIGKEVDLPVDDVARVKDRVGKLLTGPLVFVVWNLIEDAAKGEVTA